MEVMYFFIFLGLCLIFMLIPFLMGRRIFRDVNCSCRKYMLTYDERSGLIYEQVISSLGYSLKRDKIFLGLSDESCLDDFIRFVNDHYGELIELTDAKPFTGDYMKKLFEYYKNLRNYGSTTQSV